MSKSREKQIKQLMYMKSEIIKQEKKELKRLKRELESLEKENHYYNNSKCYRKKK